jgi:hypothetical protein
MNIKSGLKFLATMWGGVAAVFLVGWAVVQLGILLAGFVGAMAAGVIVLSVLIFLLGALV